LAANGTEIPFEGWVEMEFEMTTDGCDTLQLQVPMLVTAGPLSEPIIGYNVIREAVLHPTRSPSQLASLKTVFSDHPPNLVKAALALIRKESAADLDTLGTVKLGKEAQVIPKGETTLVPCRTHVRANAETTVLLEPAVLGTQWPEGLQVMEQLCHVSAGSSCRLMIPITNTTNRDIRIEGKSIIGHLHRIQAVVPGKILADVSKESSSPASSASRRPVTVNQVNTTSTTADSPWTPPVDISHSLRSSS
jgi:hypothetical protein